MGGFFFAYNSLYVSLSFSSLSIAAKYLLSLMLPIISITAALIINKSFATGCCNAQQPVVISISKPTERICLARPSEVFPPLLGSTWHSKPSSTVMPPRIKPRPRLGRGGRQILFGSCPALSGVAVCKRRRSFCCP